MLNSMRAKQNPIKKILIDENKKSFVHEQIFCHASYLGNDHVRWVKGAFNFELSDFQKLVISIIGTAFGGLYNLSVNWKKVKKPIEENTFFIRVPARNHEYGISTYSSDTLTTLVFLCLDNQIRLSISSDCFGYIGLYFSEYTNSPNLKQYLKVFEEKYHRCNGLRWRE